MGFGVFGRCCCPKCPLCPGSTSRRGWSGRPIPNCPKCVDCIQCPDYPTQVGYTTASGYIPGCPRCPECTDNPCYIPKVAAGQVCQCLPLRLLCVFVGVNSDCDCFINTCPIDALFPNHSESSGTLGTYCSTDPNLDAIPLMLRTWGNDGPACEAPASLVFESLLGNVSFGAAFGGGGVHVDVTAGNGGASIFDGHISGASCEGPWIVPNNISGCYVQQPGCDALFTSSGGYAIVYPCRC